MFLFTTAFHILALDFGAIFPCLFSIKRTQTRGCHIFGTELLVFLVWFVPANVEYCIVQVTFFSYASSIFGIFASGPIELYVKVCENIKQQLENS